MRNVLLNHLIEFEVATDNDNKTLRKIVTNIVNKGTCNIAEDKINKKVLIILFLTTFNYLKVVNTNFEEISCTEN